MSTARPIAASMTVNEVVRIAPNSVAIFGRYGIDACCGGGLPIGEAARRHGVEANRLLAELLEVAGRSGGGFPDRPAPILPMQFPLPPD